MDITPTTALIHALSQQNLKWEQVLSELVDNSIDAGASRVDIEFGPSRRLAIIDDGQGCKDIEAMFRLGDHRAHSTTKLGRYGIGLKDAALFLKGVTDIDTVHKSQRSRVAIDWNGIQDHDGRWCAPDPVVTVTNDKPGTTITFSGFSRRLPRQDEQRDKLGFIFAPALLSGRQIRLCTKGKAYPCSPYQLPTLTDMVQASFSIEGRGITLRAGIVADGVKNRYPGFTLQHGHRAIITTALGAKHYSVSRIAGIVELDGSWALTKNKDDITELQDELGETLFRACEGMLRKADLQSQQLESTALNATVSELLSDAIRQAARKQRERRTDSDEPQVGTMEPTGSGRQRRRASKVSDKDGPIDKAAKKGLTLDWGDLDNVIGKADLTAGRVTLNSGMPILESLRRDNQSGALALIAFGIFVHGCQEDVYRKRWLPTMEPRDFMEDWSAVVSKMPDLSSKARRKTA